MKMPVRLTEEPIVEAVWELRFESDNESVADVLPGLVYQTLRSEYPRIVRLPTADIPRAVIDHDPSLRYVPMIRMESDRSAVLLGEHVVALSVRRPYPGWATFSAGILRLIDVLRDTQLIATLERTSLRYSDVINVGSQPSLEWLNLTVKLGHHRIDTHPVQLRAEIRTGRLTQIVQAISPVDVTFSDNDNSLRGVLLDVDTIRNIGPGESWPTVLDELETMHRMTKELFFSLLTEETLRSLGPVYEE